MKSLLLFLAIGLSIISQAFAQTTYHVYYLGGQSNMDGYGYVRDLPKSLTGVREGVYIFHGNPAPDGAPVDGKGLWSELRPGHGVGFSSDGKKNEYSNRFGLELTFVDRLQELHPAENIALIKYSRGGTSIDTAAAANFGSWDPDYDEGNGVNQYDHSILESG